MLPLAKSCCCPGASKSWGSSALNGKSEGWKYGNGGVVLNRIDSVDVLIPV